MSERTMESRESIDLDLNRYFLILKRWWLPAFSIFVVTVMLSAISTKFIKPSYEAEGKLLFRVPSFKVAGTSISPSFSEGGDSGDLKPLVATQNPISTQMEVITSPALLQRTIDKLKLKDKEGKPLEVQALQKSLNLKIIGGTDVLRITYTSPDPEEAAAVINTMMAFYLENDILSNRSEAGATRQFMAKQLPKTQAAVNNAEVALRIFKQKHQIADLSEETKSAVATIGNLDNEMNNVKAQLDEVNAQTNELRQRVELNSQQAIAVSALSQSPAVQGVLTQLQETDRQLAIERSRFLDDNPIIINLEAKKASLKSLLQQQIGQTIGNRTQAIGNQTQVPQNLLQIGELRQGLIQNFLQSEIQRFGLTQKLSSLYNSRASYEQRVKLIPQLAQNQRELERKVEVAESTYQTLLKKVQELQLVENTNTASSRIIAQALVPKKPIAGKKIIVLVLGVMFGLFFATTTVLILGMRDRSLKTLKEVRDVFGYTLLGIIPSSVKKIRSRYSNSEATTQTIAVRDTPHSLTSEMYRMIQANLKFLSSDKVLKTIVVTSAVPKEGKSTVSANLAAAIAQLGRQVLLIDADMRVPSQHYLWQLSNSVGLSEVLIDQVEFDIAVSKVMDNLDVLTAGVRPPNPLALLDSKRMASLIENFSSQHNYDFVIIDAPPLLLAADALTLSQMTDGILLVARPGVIDSNSAAAAQEMLHRSSHNVLGLVVNGVIDKNESSSYFSYAKEYFTHQDLPKKVKPQKRIPDKSSV
ncbi:MAG: GumC family protein [Nostoc sp. DedVER02]|uniref:GumC family protein n=1 Tax=unclassified Nostoc TaxID=2593658 RepID=UPI002AD39F21|nr:MULTISPECIES: polysaccharide biosynthesis tyrosine autokinase [unclassified Nostoc]MDZ7985147.1 polysaccharide biosynthesis tyrosine autokinase [Nostoc sp. DedVER02]MDZ8113269.1 polysaccharide biosynthesis tyrosine autokinase [Nostoc sp. DedVER01b]